MRWGLARMGLAGLVAAATGCTGEVDALVGLLEPLRVPEGTFHPGELATVQGDALRVTSIESPSGLAVVGQQDRSLGGRTTQGAWAIALRLRGLGSGWWVLPVDDLEPQFPGERGFFVPYDLGTGLPAGAHTLELAAVDEDGRRGPVFDLGLCVQDDVIPTGLAGCDPTIAPPAAIVSLVWDRPVDLDLRVHTPDGQELAWKAPTTAAPVDGAPIPDEALDEPTLGRLDRDSNGGCIIDGRNAEAVVWAEPPAETDPFAVYVDLFEACGQRGTNFAVSVYQRREHEDGTWSIEQTARRTGAVDSLHVSGGEGPGLYVLAADLR
jgi:hypothetical protein